MSPRRRIFRSSRSPRLRGSGLALTACVAVLLSSGVGLPSNLRSPGPPDADWSALAFEVRVLDGATLRLGDRTMRLSGVEPPARGEACADPSGRPFDCGAAAAEALSRLVNGRSVVCRAEHAWAPGHALGTCQAGGAELNSGMVAAGWALATRRDTPLTEQEAVARAAARGLWAGGFSRPEAWHRRP
ncbi:MAG TPA: thermonuclease family protein [Acetobacteraceae bacterium]|nr:thermonuclease family protein [Acetobacteraceae bacterium]